MALQTIFALFDDLTQASAAIEALSGAGFGEEQISCVTRGTPRGERQEQMETIIDAPNLPTRATVAGAAVGGTGGLIAGMVALAVPGFGPILALGPLAALLGAALGAGAGNIAGNLGAGERALTYERSIQMGNVLVAVAAEEGEPADRAERILSEQGGREIYRAV